MAPSAPLVGSIIERIPGTKPKANGNFPAETNNGFPAVQHRSKSAFARGREEVKKAGVNGLKRTRDSDVPKLEIAPGVGAKEKRAETPTDWREQISKDNERRVDDMNEDEREAERREIFERFGAGVGDVLKRARERRVATGGGIPITSSERPISISMPTSRAHTPPLPPALISPTRPSSRADRPRKLRFAKLEPGDVHVYESAPSSPKEKKRVLALMPPGDNEGVVSLGVWKGKMKEVDDESMPPLLDDEMPPLKVEGICGDERPQLADKGDDLEEGSPEYIRRRYFPDAPVDNPDIEWLRSPSSHSASGSSIITNTQPQIRFSLSGTPIPPSLSSSLPSHLGLHHHAEGAHAGYTLDDIFLLTRSSVRAQRAAMSGVLAGVGRWLASQQADLDANMKLPEADSNANADADAAYKKRLQDLLDQKASIMTRIIAAGLQAMAEKGVVGMRGVELVWVGVVLLGGRCARNNHGEGNEEDTWNPVAEGEDTPLIAHKYVAQFLEQVHEQLGEGEVDARIQTWLIEILYELVRNDAVVRDAAVRMRMIGRRRAGLVRRILEVGIWERLVAVAQTGIDFDGSAYTPIRTINAHTNSQPKPMPAWTALKLLHMLIASRRDNAMLISGEGNEADGLGVGDLLMRCLVLCSMKLSATSTNSPLSSYSLSTSTSTTRSTFTSSPAPPAPSTSPSDHISTHTVTYVILLTHILRIYQALACYGLQTGVAKTYVEELAMIERVVCAFSTQSVLGSQYASAPSSNNPISHPNTLQSQHLKLQETWCNLVETWMICAIDPHATTPVHSIGWALVYSWGWAGGVLAVQDGLDGLGDNEKMNENERKANVNVNADTSGNVHQNEKRPMALEIVRVWASTFNAQSAWLEGCRVNGMRGGEGERRELLESRGRMWALDGEENEPGNVSSKGKGKASSVVEDALDHVERLVWRLEGGSDLDRHVEMDAGVELGAELKTSLTLLASAMRLWVACVPLPASPSSTHTAYSEGPPPSTEPPFVLPFERLGSLARRLVSVRAKTTRASPTVHTRFQPQTNSFTRRHISLFLSSYLELSARLSSTNITRELCVSQDLWMAQCFSVLCGLGEGDEWIFQDLLGLGPTKGVLALITERWARERGLDVYTGEWTWSHDGKGGFLDVLEPFLKYIARPDHEVVVSPLRANPRSVREATTLVMTSERRDEKGMRKEERPASILPLGRDWALIPFDHLLRSGVSPVFNLSVRSPLPNEDDNTEEDPGSSSHISSTPHASRYATPTWNPSELDIVRSALFLAKVVQETLSNMGLGEIMMSRDEAVWRCMQVFGLEFVGLGMNAASGQGGEDEAAGGRTVGGGGAEEVFRDEYVDRLMEGMLRPYLYGNGFDNSATSTDTLETASAPFLQPTPFYQFYTDFVALYDAISFSHPLFATLLTPPLSMRYAKDYRKLLFCDYAHLVKTIRTPVESLLSKDVWEFLEPREKDGEVLSGYLGMLLRGEVDGFLRLVAVHHVASCVWADLRGEDEGDHTLDAQAALMFKAIIQRGSNDAVRQVVLYHQADKGPKGGLRVKVLLPPACFDPEGLSEDVKRVRRETVIRWGGEKLLGGIRGLLGG